MKEYDKLKVKEIVERLLDSQIFEIWLGTGIIIFKINILSMTIVDVSNDLIGVENEIVNSFKFHLPENFIVKWNIQIEDFGIYFEERRLGHTDHLVFAWFIENNKCGPDNSSLDKALLYELLSTMLTDKYGEIV